MNQENRKASWGDSLPSVVAQCLIVVGSVLPLGLLLSAVAGLSAFVLVPFIGHGLDVQQVEGIVYALMGLVAFLFVPVLVHGVLMSLMEHTSTFAWARLCWRSLPGRYPALLVLSAACVAAEALAWQAFGCLPQFPGLGELRLVSAAAIAVAVLLLMGLTYPCGSGGTR